MAIDIGSPAIDRDSHINYPGYTFILKDNPASGPTTIKQLAIYPYGSSDITGVKVGIFYTTNGNTLKCRAVADIGTVTGGAGRQVFDVSLAVQAGDYLGYHHDTQEVEMSASGFSGLWWTSTDTCVVDDETTYNSIGNYTISVYGTDTLEYTEEQLVNNAGFNLFGSLFTRVGQRLTVPNRTIIRLAFILAKFGSPVGDITFTIRKVSDDPHIINSKIWGDAGDLTIFDYWYEVEFDTPATINEEVRMQAEFSGGDNMNYIMVRYQNTDVKADEMLTRYLSSPYDVETQDCTYIYTYTVPVVGIGAQYVQINPLGINIYRAGRPN